MTLQIAEARKLISKPIFCFIKETYQYAEYQRKQSKKISKINFQTYIPK